MFSLECYLVLKWFNIISGIVCFIFFILVVSSRIMFFYGCFMIEFIVSVVVIWIRIIF